MKLRNNIDESDGLTWTSHHLLNVPHPLISVSCHNALITMRHERITRYSLLSVLLPSLRETFLPWVPCLTPLPVAAARYVCRRCPVAVVTSDRADSRRRACFRHPGSIAGHRVGRRCPPTAPLPRDRPVGWDETGRRALAEVDRTSSAVQEDIYIAVDKHSCSDGGRLLQITRLMDLSRRGSRLLRRIDDSPAANRGTRTISNDDNESSHIKTGWIYTCL